MITVHTIITSKLPKDKRNGLLILKVLSLLICMEESMRSNKDNANLNYSLFLTKMLMIKELLLWSRKDQISI